MQTLDVFGRKDEFKEFLKLFVKPALANKNGRILWPICFTYSPTESAFAVGLSSAYTKLSLVFREYPRPIPNIPEPTIDSKGFLTAVDMELERGISLQF